MTLAHRVAVMHAGKLQQFDTPINIYERPTNKFVAGFMGSPSMNFLVGKLDHAQRSALSKNLASALAHFDIGHLAAANHSAANLVRLLRELGILADE